MHIIVLVLNLVTIEFLFPWFVNNVLIVKIYFNNLEHVNILEIKKHFAPSL